MTTPETVINEAPEPPRACWTRQETKRAEVFPRHQGGRRRRQLDSHPAYALAARLSARLERQEEPV